MSPITLRVKITQVQAGLLLQGYVRSSSRDLSSDKSPSSPGTLVVKENTIAGIQSIRFSVVDHDPIGVQLGTSVGRTRVERRSFALRRFHDLSVQLRC